jgi:hypothetical protein
VKPTKMIRRIFFILTLILICTGCAGSGNLGAQNTGNSPNDPSMDEEIVARHLPALVMGSRFTYQDTDLSNGKIYKVAIIVKEMKEFRRKLSYWIEVSREEKSYFDIYDMSLNWIGSFADGKELESAEPCIQVFNWPLKIGKKWNSNYTVKEYSGGAHLSHSKTGVNIRTYEEVKVPAGTFKALRIQAGEETFWYAPSIGWAVKEQIGPQGKDGWLLELVEYSIP